MVLCLIEVEDRGVCNQQIIDLDHHFVLGHVALTGEHFTGGHVPRLKATGHGELGALAVLDGPGLDQAIEDAVPLEAGQNLSTKDLEEQGVVLCPCARGVVNSTRT